jgi:hypothetical protein
MKGKEGKDTVHVKVMIRRVFAYKESGWSSFLDEDADGNIQRLKGTLANEPKTDMTYQIEMEAKATQTMKTKVPPHGCCGSSLMMEARQCMARRTCCSWNWHLP